MPRSLTKINDLFITGLAPETNLSLYRQRSRRTCLLPRLVLRPSTGHPLPAQS